jgi:hypothetical protein
MIDGRWYGVAFLCVSTLAACQEPRDLTLPEASQVEAWYESQEGLRAQVTGNVAVITIAQSAQQIRRGGALWAKVGPYIYLFTEETFQLFEAFPGLAAVRVIKRVGDSEVSNVLLARDELSGVLWRRSLNIAGRARRDGTDRVTLLEDLVEWGETHTDFTYNSRYTRR